MVELISVHLPKTAGRSFHTALEEIYGDGLALDYGFQEGPGDLDGVRVIHGHFPAAKYAGRFPDARIIIWLRHPVDRAISYYHYWRRIARHGNPIHDRFLGENMSLLEFARIDEVRSELFGMYLLDFDPSRFFFVGITERYDRDFEELGRRMGWPRTTRQKRNAARSKPRVTPEERAGLERIFAQDIEFYESRLADRRPRRRWFGG